MSSLETLISADQIQAKIKALAEQICADFNDIDELHCVVVLEGGRTFARDLKLAIQDMSRLQIVEHFIKVSSYGDQTESSKEVKLMSDFTADLKGKNVLIIDDIVDTGLTMRFLLNYFEKLLPKSLDITALLNKASRRIASTDVTVRYTGFEIPDQFVVGYGLDYAGHYRELPYIALGNFS